MTPKKIKKFPKIKTPKFGLSFLFSHIFFKQLNEEETKCDDMEASGHLKPEEVKKRQSILARDFITLFEKRYGDEFKMLLAEAKTPIEYLGRFCKFFDLFLSDVSMLELIEGKHNPSNAEKHSHVARGVDRSRHEINKVFAAIEIFLEKKHIKDE